jgi:predicted nucleic acid-binding protein
MPTDYARASFFDASALVKLYVQEERSGLVRKYFNQEATKYTTSFCFYEALSILKTKWRSRSILTQDQYLEACFRLTAWFANNERWIRNPDLTDVETLFAAKVLAKSHMLDMSDALQLVVLKNGYFSGFASGSATVFVTADRELAMVADSIGLKTWNVMDSEAPE